jgi:hypothetical protein
MKPRRLHRLTFFSIRSESVGALISVTDYTDQKRCRGVCAKRLSLSFGGWHSRHYNDAIRFAFRP